MLRFLGVRLINCTRQPIGFAATDLERKTARIVGIGNIGGRTAVLCKAFGMKLIAYDPHLGAEEIAAKGAVKVELDKLLAQSDFVSVHCPRNEEVLEMFTLEKFRKMKRSAYFINTARGSIHVEDDLADALTAGQIQGVGWMCSVPNRRSRIIVCWPSRRCWQAHTPQG